MHKAAQAYFQTQVSTTSQGQLLIMLYDGAIKFLNQAKDKIDQRDYAAKGILISKALDVINELDGSLNPEQGPELAENLHKLYFYCSTRLLNANLKMDIALIDEVIRILGGLRSAYAQIMDTPEAMAAQKKLTATQRTDVLPSQQRGTMGQPIAGGLSGVTGGTAAKRYGAQQGTKPAPAPQSQATPSVATPPVSDPAENTAVSHSVAPQAGHVVHTAQTAPAVEEKTPQATVQTNGTLPPAKPAGFGFTSRKLTDIYRTTADSR